MLTVNLPLLTSVLSISCIIAVGRRKWWGHMFGVANCIAFTVIAFKPGQWGYLPSNAVCIVLYAMNAWKWRRDGNVGKVLATEPAPLRRDVAGADEHVPHAKGGRLFLLQGGLQVPSDSRQVGTAAD